MKSDDRLLVGQWIWICAVVIFVGGGWWAASIAQEPAQVSQYTKDALDSARIEMTGSEGLEFPTRPSAVIEGPTEVQLGELVVLDASASTGTGFSWEIDPSNPIAPQHAVDTSGKYLYLAVPLNAKRFVVVLGVADNGEVAQLKHVITVGNSPDPIPNPDPDPNPLTGLAKQVYDWKIELVPADKLSLCEALATSHEAIASQIAAGALKTPEEVLKATADSNRDAVGADNRDAFLPFFTKMSLHLNAEQAKGGMVDLEKIRLMWLEIAKGLRGK
jgi:hypothetical protein